jgi:iron complex transport system substrate-binding protein
MVDNGGQLYPSRIVSLSPSNTEILFAVGAGNKVVGVTDYCDHPQQLEEQIKSKQTVRVGGYWDPSVEKIVKLNPDLVIVSTAKCSNKTNQCKTSCSRSCELTIKTAKKLESLGINVLVLAPHSLDDVLRNILLVGTATGNRSKAREITNNLRQRINTVIEASKQITIKPKVYFEVWKEPYVSVNSQTWIGNLISLAGGQNVFGNAPTEWPLIAPEDVIDVDPDVMLFPVIPNVAPFWESFEIVKNRECWKKVSAIKNDCLYTVLRDCVSRPGPRLVDSLERLFEIFNKIS